MRENDILPWTQAIWLLVIAPACERSDPWRTWTSWSTVHTGRNSSKVWRRSRWSWESVSRVCILTAYDATNSTRKFSIIFKWFQMDFMVSICFNQQYIVWPKGSWILWWAAISFWRGPMGGLLLHCFEAFNNMHKNAKEGERNRLK